MNNEVEEIIKDLITRVWNTEKEYYFNAAERNIREAELTYIYYELEEKIGALDQKTLEGYEEEIEELEAENTALANENYNLRLQNDSLLNRLDKISRVVNDTWS